MNMIWIQAGAELGQAQLKLGLDFDFQQILFFLILFESFVGLIE